MLVVYIALILIAFFFSIVISKVRYFLQALFALIGYIFLVIFWWNPSFEELWRSLTTFPQQNLVAFLFVAIVFFVVFVFFSMLMIAFARDYWRQRV